MESWVDLTIDLTSDTGEDATTSDTGEDAFTSDMYNRRLLAFYVPTLPVWYLFLASLTATVKPPNNNVHWGRPAWPLLRGCSSWGVLYI